MNKVKYSLPEAAEIWMNDLTWARINTAIAKKEGKNPCTTVTIAPGDIRRKRDPAAVLCEMGHSDLVKKLQLQPVNKSIGEYDNEKR